MIGIIGGILGSASAILFIHLIHSAQTLRENTPQLVFMLPVAGLLIRYLYLRFGTGIKEAPTLIISSYLTHLVGGSAGREGAIIHLARITSTATGKFFNFEERKIKKLIIASIGSGFGAALGAPFAGFIFGFEVNRQPFFRFKTLLHSAIAAVVAQFIIRISKVTHFALPSFQVPDFAINAFVFITMAGVVFGFTTVLYHQFKKYYESRLAQHSPLFAGFIGGGTLFTLYCVFNLKNFQGLGEAGIIQAQLQTMPLSTAFHKLLLTIITLGSGFQGGEFFPLAFIGSSIGSSFGFINASYAQLASSIGFAAIYGAATKTPIASIFLLAEIFGWKIIPYAACAIFMADRIHNRLSFKSGQDS